MGRASGIVLFVVVVLAAGGALGVLARTWLDGRQRQEQAPSSAAPAGAVGVPTAVANQPTAPAVEARAPTPAPAAAPLSNDMVLEVSEADLQSQVNRMLVGQSLGRTPLGEATIESASVALRDRQIRVKGDARAGPVNAPFIATGTVAPDGNGRPLVKVSEATVGGVLLPDTARTALTDSLQSQVDRLFAGREMKVRTIDIADGKMRVVGTAGS
jgi:hypothetical protein